MISMMKEASSSTATLPVEVEGDWLCFFGWCLSITLEDWQSTKQEEQYEGDLMQLRFQL